MERIRATIGGRTVSGLAAGSGEGLLFLHGMGGGAADWRDQLATFAGRFHAVALDLPGYGGSDAPPGRYEFAAVAKIIGAWLASRASPVHVVGLSMGGRIAMLAAQTHPHAIRSLTLVSTSPCYAPHLDAAERHDAIGTRVAAIAKTPFEQVIANDVERIVSLRACAGAAARVANSLRTVGAERYARSIAALAGFDARGILPEIRTAAAVVIGADDPTVTPGDGRDLVAALRGRTLQVVEDAGHVTNIDQPAAFDRALAAILDATTVP